MDTAMARPTATLARPTSTLEADRINRYAEDIIEMHSRLTFRRLPLEISGVPDFVSDELDDGLLTVTCRDSQIPPRYLRGILGFRLSEYLRLGLMSRELIYKAALYHEPMAAKGVIEDLHTVTIDAKTGQIVGYICMACSPDPKPLPLDSPRRTRFLIERGHDVDLLAEFADPGLTTHNAFETKRFVRAGSISDETKARRVPWHLLLGLTSAIVKNDDIRLIVGDATEEGALRHLRLIGFDPVVVEGTKPVLPESELVWPMHDLMKFKPFAALVPKHLAENVAIMRSGLKTEEGMERLIADLWASWRSRQ